MGAQIQDIAKMISDFGITVIIVAIFIYIIIKLLGYLFAYLDKKLDRKTHDEQINVRNEANIEIYNLLNESMSKFTDIKRVQVIEFSNSVMSVAHMPFKYMNCTYEVCRLDQKACGHLIDKISTSLFTPFFQKLQENQVYILDTVSSPESVCGAMQDFLKLEDATKSLCSMMITSKDKSIGYVTMKKDTHFTPEELEEIDMLSDRICAILSVLDI